MKDEHRLVIEYLKTEKGKELLKPLIEDIDWSGFHIDAIGEVEEPEIIAFYNKQDPDVRGKVLTRGFRQAAYESVDIEKQELKLIAKSKHTFEKNFGVVVPNLPKNFALRLRFLRNRQSAKTASSNVVRDYNANNELDFFFVLLNSWITYAGSGKDRKFFLDIFDEENLTLSIPLSNKPKNSPTPDKKYTDEDVEDVLTIRIDGGANVPNERKLADEGRQEPNI
jgi:hypothetical protein